MSFFLLLSLLHLLVCVVRGDVFNTEEVSLRGAGKRIEAALNVHLVPHTHDDVGWLKTVDQYFYGANNSIQNAGVQYILDTVIDQLNLNPNRKFIYVEQAFFQRWWAEQDAETRTLVKKLVANGQLEFINGGWCMHDEAATHYVAMVDQTTLGHSFLKEEFNVVPTIGWQIDPFGHSSTQASLLSARVGFQGLFFARIDYQDSDHRNALKEFEMIWRPSPSLGEAGQVFTGAFERNGYGSPGGFDWDHDSGDAPFQDDPNLEDYNVDSRVEDFLKTVMDQFSANVGNDIMLTMGSDFEYSNAHTWFKNLDKLIDYVNKDGRVNVFYSTPSIYLKAKMSYNVTWSVKTDDFFPYADCPHCYWTGYFTSRPALKRYVRSNSGYLNTARQIEFFSGFDGSFTFPLNEALGLAQHHDAVSGTSKQHVAYDYAYRLAAGAVVAENMVNVAFAQFTAKFGTLLSTFTQCGLLNETICPATQTSNSFVVLVYSALGRSRQEVVRIPVNRPNAYTVYDNTGTVIPSQTLPSFMPFPKQTPAPFVVYFVVQTPASGFNTYFVQASTSLPQVPVKVSSEADMFIENSAVKVDYTSSRLVSITNKKSGVSTQVTQDFLWYPSAVGGEGFQNGGAYIFRPNASTAYPACTGTTPAVEVVKGPVVNEIRFLFCDWVAQTVRLNGADVAVEFEYHIGSVPISDGKGKEVITRYSTDVASNSLSYTDSNGREFQKRKRNYRPTWPLIINEPVAGNYYPVNAAAYINDNTKQFSVLNDRSQGGGSINDGQFELMVHRRLLADDSRGVGEPLNETDAIGAYPNPVRIGTGLRIVGSHYVIVDSPATSLSQVRALQSRIFSPVVLGFTPIPAGMGGISDWIAKHEVKGSALSADLPINVDLMTVQALGSGKKFLLRLSHQFGVGEDPVYSLPVKVDLSILFSGLIISNIQEVSLTNNQNATDVKPFQWKVRDDVNPTKFDQKPLIDMIVTINPIDIRTFIVTTI